MPGWDGLGKLSTSHTKAPTDLPILQQVATALRKQGGMDGLFLPQLLKGQRRPQRRNTSFNVALGDSSPGAFLIPF